MTDQSEPEDTCRPVEVDGETIRVRGATELTTEGHAALTALVRAAKAKMAAEPPPIRQQLQAVAFNAVAPALKQHGEWLRLTARRAVANAVLAAIEEHLDVGDAEAWCKICRRVWDGKHHRCESDAEQRVARVHAALASFDDRGVMRIGYSNFDIPTAGEVLTAVRAALEEPEQSPRTTPDNSPTSSDTPDNSLRDQPDRHPAIDAWGSAFDRANHAEQQRDRLAGVLSEVLAAFVHKVDGYRIPRRSAEADVVTLEKWRSILSDNRGHQ